MLAVKAGTDVEKRHALALQEGLQHRAVRADKRAVDRPRMRCCLELGASFAQEELPKPPPSARLAASLALWRSESLAA